jgi:hypothetical protein
MTCSIGIMTRSPAEAPDQWLLNPSWLMMSLSFNRDSYHENMEALVACWWFGTCFLFFPSYWECHHPNRRSPSFFRVVGLKTTNQINFKPSLAIYNNQ